MHDIEEIWEKSWCLDCEDLPDADCYARRHEIVEPDDIDPPPLKPDLTGTPAPQHDVKHF